MQVQPNDDTKDLARLLRVIADETRLRVLGLLAGRPHYAREIAAALSLTPPTVSHHMRKLVESGIVVATSEAQRKHYSLNAELLGELRTVGVTAKDRQPTKDAGATTDEQTYRNRVLGSFFDGERLKTIPARRKQRVVVLQHLLERFDPNRSYPETEVNDMLRNAHDDVATLRRELVDYGFMTRERGTYQVSRSPPGRSIHVAQEIVGDERAWLGSLIHSAIARSNPSR